jgi:hypothetical protein
LWRNLAVAALLGALGLGAVVRNQTVTVVGVILAGFFLEPTLLATVPRTERPRVTSRVRSSAGARPEHRSSAHGADPRGLTAADVEAIACRVVELLRDESRLSNHVDTTAVATMLGVSGDWVREHAAAWCDPIGDNPKGGALRFEPRR